ncbi:hypothetical protein Calab_3454 [Caldithrix abyssi DSM 13497]|uniref:Uncharacterized protein n=1 Tax=Caldithrix abyssi DSM 13497 TaxID=880073 RepID=H1XWS7_CALAY|nr:hypothetical protein [Caldithrix abyssi]APF19126.1 hypothetical protein Cabys_2377 [Caldithrix abyssi DSM 13497]EHO43053.1 hypothetical protein Calab_3454 [Caldithrix abyssi DSM 13497]
MSKIFVYFFSIFFDRNKIKQLAVMGWLVTMRRVQSRLTTINRDLRLAPTGEAHLLVDEVDVLPLERETLETTAEGLSLADHAD